MQPVQVIPVGGPIPAVQAGGYQHTIPVQPVIDRDYSVSSYNTPAESYGAPLSSSSSYNQQLDTYAAPAAPASQSYSNPITNYRGPKQSSQVYSPTASKKIDNLELYQTNFNVDSSPRPVRSGRLDQCYCVPAGQCPADKIIGNKPNKDYSKLINPRVKNTQIDITAVSGRSGLDDADEETTTLNPEVEEPTTEVDVEEETEKSRRRRQNEESEPAVEKLSNEFVPETEEIDASSRLIKDDIELSEEEQELLKKIKEKKKEQRKKERQEKLKKKAAETLISKNSEIEDLDSENKSFDSLASLGNDVTNKVGSGVDSVKTGVSVSNSSKYCNILLMMML